MSSGAAHVPVVTVRNAGSGDAAAIARLSRELGYRRQVRFTTEAQRTQSFTGK